MEIRKSSKIVVELKSDQTALTNADKESHEIITERLNNRFSGLPIVSEESKKLPFLTLKERQKWKKYFLVDPIDGTAGFIDPKSNQFVVNIALMEVNPETGESYPVFGVVAAPAFDTIYWGGQGLGAFSRVGNGPETRLAQTPFNHDSPVLVNSSGNDTARATRYRELFSRKFPGTISYPAVGAAYKMVQLMKGEAHVYPRLGKQWGSEETQVADWDMTAPQAVLEGMGGFIVDAHEARYSYNKAESFKNEDFIAFADSEKRKALPAVWNLELVKRLSDEKDE